MGEREQIFLVQNDAGFSRTFSRLLGIAGHSVVAEAWDLNSTRMIIENPALDFSVAIIADRLPNLGDGARIAGYIREHRPDAAIVALSSNPQKFGDINLSKKDSPKSWLDAISGLKVLDTEVPV